MQKVHLGCTCGLHRSNWSAEQRAYYEYTRQNATTTTYTDITPKAPSDTFEVILGWVLIIAWLAWCIL